MICESRRTGRDDRGRLSILKSGTAAIVVLNVFLLYQAIPTLFGSGSSGG